MITTLILIGSGAFTIGFVIGISVSRAILVSAVDEAISSFRPAKTITLPNVAPPPPPPGGKTAYTPGRVPTRGSR